MSGTLRILREFAATRWCRRLRTRASVERRQRRLLRRHLRYLQRHSPYFARLAPITTLRDLPFMDKTVMMEHFDAMNTVAVTRDEALRLAMANERSRDFSGDLNGCSVGVSSGTSGHRGVFVVSEAERAAWVGTVLARTLPRRQLYGHRIALFLRADNTLYESVGSRAVSFSYFDVYGDTAENLARLERYQPTILVAPPSVLLEIADAAESGTFTGAPVRVYSVAEVLEIADAARIARALRQPVVHQLYQCTEGFLAHTCAHGTLHLNEDNVLIEREDLGDGRFTPIVTDLRRRAQPIVRYRLGDVLRASEHPCRCGSALTAIDRIEGRVGDTLLWPTASGVPRRVFTDLVSRAMVFAEGFQEYQIVQTGPRTLDVALDQLDDAARQSVAAELGRLAERLGCERPDLVFVPYVRDSAVKMRRVQRRDGGAHDAAL